MHRAIQSLAVLLTIAGLIIIAQGISAVHGSHMHGFHTYLGAAVIAFALLQPAAAFMRPHAPEGEEAKSPQRASWERLHHIVGYGLLLAGLANVFLGVTNGHLEGTHVPDELWPLIGVCLAGLLIAAVIARRSNSEEPAVAPTVMSAAPPKSTSV